MFTSTHAHSASTFLWRDHKHSYIAYYCLHIFIFLFSFSIFTAYIYKLTLFITKSFCRKQITRSSHYLLRFSEGYISHKSRKAQHKKIFFIKLIIVINSAPNARITCLACHFVFSFYRLSGMLQCGYAPIMSKSHTLRSNTTRR